MINIEKPFPWPAAVLIPAGWVASAFRWLRERWYIRRLTGSWRGEILFVCELPEDPFDLSEWIDVSEWLGTFPESAPWVNHTEEKPPVEFHREY